MLKKIYYWLHRNLSKPEEKEEPSGGWWHSRVRQEVVHLCQNCRGKLLEVGCGEGLFITRLALSHSSLEIFAVDNNINKLLEAKEKCEEKKLKNIKLIYGSATNLPFEDGFFDGIVCINTFVNMESMDIVSQTLAHMARVCKRGGRIIFDFRNSFNFLLKLKYKLAPYYDPTVKEDKLPLNTYNPKHIEEILGKLNLKIVNKIFIGFPKNVLAPIIIVEAEKC